MRTVTEVPKLRKILTITSPVPSVLQKMDGSWNNSEMETLDLLINTHFPLGQNLDMRVNVSESSPREDCHSIMSLGAIKWAIATLNRSRNISGPFAISEFG